MLGYIISDKERINVKEHKIQSFDILHKKDLNIFVIQNNKVFYKNNIINNACKYGHIEVLEWFKNSGYEFNYNEVAIYQASGYGHIQVLEWFKNSGYKFKYNQYAITYAIQNGHIKVLEWFKNSGYKFKHDYWAFYFASQNKYVQILKFFSNNFNIKKLIIQLKKNIFIKTINFKTTNEYIKGYQKN